MADPVQNRRPLLRCVPRGGARPYHVLHRTAVDVDGQRWLQGTVCAPGPTIEGPGDLATQVVRIRGVDVRFVMESQAEATARMHQRWADDASARVRRGT